VGVGGSMANIEKLETKIFRIDVSSLNPEQYILLLDIFQRFHVTFRCVNNEIQYATSGDRSAEILADCKNNGLLLIAQRAQVRD
jgi:hypothetical protein